jgi:hypothetical protein
MSAKVNAEREIALLLRERDKRCSMFRFAVSLCQENRALTQKNALLTRELLGSKEREAIIVNFCNEKGKILYINHQYFPRPTTK